MKSWPSFSATLCQAMTCCVLRMVQGARCKVQGAAWCMGERTIKLAPSWPRVDEGGGVLVLVLVTVTHPARVRCNVERRMGRLASWLRLGPQQQPISRVEL